MTQRIYTILALTTPLLAIIFLNPTTALTTYIGTTINAIIITEIIYPTSDNQP